MELNDLQAVEPSGLGQATRRAHVIGAGPVGLMVAALLQPIEGLSVVLYEKRAGYTRLRMVHLEPYLAADSVESYRAGHIDQDDLQAIFDHDGLEEIIGFRQTIEPDLKALLDEWTLGFCPLNEIEDSLSLLLESRAGSRVQRITGVMSLADVQALVDPGDIVIDCTGRNSLLRDALVPRDDEFEGGENTVNLRVECALVVTFLYDKNYSCNELCKYYKNSENPNYKFIPSVSRTFYDDDISCVTGIIRITPDEAELMPTQFRGEWLRENFPEIALSMDNFIARMESETHGQIVGDLDIISIPLNLYHARNATSRLLRQRGESGHPFSTAPVFLVGDSAIGSPYFQSISLGFECAMYLAELFSRPELDIDEILDLYERYVYQQWMYVYIRSKLIKHHKDIFEVLDDKLGLLELIRLY